MTHKSTKHKTTYLPLLSHDDIFNGISAEMCSSEEHIFYKINLRQLTTLFLNIYSENYMKYNEYGIHYNMHLQHAIRQPLAVTEF
jgi:hypothetical protein